MGAVPLCLFVMDTYWLPKNFSQKFILETMRISPFKSVCMAVTVMPGFSSQLYSRDYNRVSFILVIKITFILRAFVFLIKHAQLPDIKLLTKDRTDLLTIDFVGCQCFGVRSFPFEQPKYEVRGHINFPNLSSSTHIFLSNIFSNKKSTANSNCQKNNNNNNKRTNN